MSKMKANIKKLWVDALKSGEYGQTTHALTDGEGNFCCLGVLCDLHRKATKKKGWKDCRYRGEGAVAPAVVCEWAGLPASNPDVPGMKMNEHSYLDETLAHLNDHGASFNRIADIIDATF